MPSCDYAASLAAPTGNTIPPLHWWRYLPAPAFTAAHLAVIKRAVRGFSFISEPRWPAAAEGDPTSAVGVALRAFKRHRKPNPNRDLVMSALLRYAIEGDTTAALVLSFVLDRIVITNPACTLLAASWQARSRRPRSDHLAKGA